MKNIWRRIPVSALAFLLLDTQGVTAANSGQSPSNDVTVCVGSDSMMRLSNSGACPIGTKRIDVAGSGSQKDLRNLEPQNENDPLDPAKKPEQLRQLVLKSPSRTCSRRGP
jgi:hypothetical protein